MTHPLPDARLLADYAPPVGANTIINLLAWCVTAAGVFGLITVGTLMALQLRRGEPGEGGEHFRGVFFVTLACLLATSAQPLVTVLGDLRLLGGP
ncbi:hypothetical protein [Streptomyces sp. NBC_00996]|uniref:hypothetical protein n=1 Tax=Streptomyces sp. NBC_00996 TaxID=2903710 RepID=UPI00386A14EE|nr:hypothetical protein OG390_09145 [Streptomyces sp. NBC_00996]